MNTFFILNALKEIILKYNLPNYTKNDIENNAKDNLVFRGVSIDSRTITKGDIFFAIKGANFNGNNFVKDAIDNGASLVITEFECHQNISCIQDISYKNIPYIMVTSSVKALELCSQFYRKFVKSKVIAITGSVGKTTTKCILGKILENFGETVSSPKSFNNNIGLPLSLLSIKETTKYGVMEIGSNNNGEISHLSKISSPDISIITSIAPAHIGNFGSFDAIAKEKSSIIEHTKDLMIFSDQSKYLDFFTDESRKFKIPYLTFGESKKSVIQIVDKHEDCDSLMSEIIVRTPSNELKLKVNFVGKKIDSLLASLCVCYYFDLNFDIISNILSNIYLEEGRGNFFNVKLDFSRNIKVIDDSYNANPYSMDESLMSFSKMNNSGRKVLILGKMLELGEKSDFYHEELAKEIDKVNANIVITVGFKSKNSIFFNSMEDMDKIEFLSQLKDEDLLLVKGSRGSEVYKIINFLKSKNMTVNHY